MEQFHCLTRRNALLFDGDVVLHHLLHAGLDLSQQFFIQGDILRRNLAEITAAHGKLYLHLLQVLIADRIVHGL